jgi:hypothetical protein
MKYKLLPTWQHVRKLSYKIENLFRKIETAGSPPTGVAGKRIARAFRSEIDKKSKHMIAEWRKKIEKYFEQEKQRMVEQHLQTIRAEYDVKIEYLRQSAATQKAGGADNKRTLQRKAKLEREKTLRLRKESERANHEIDKGHKERVDGYMEEYKRKLAPQGFHFRLKFAIDTYGGKAYAGSMVMSSDPKGRGEWRKLGSVTAPTKK